MLLDKIALEKNEMNKEKNLILEEKKEVIKKGGLFVIGTERHESRRIDNQLRGRSGRQGDPGKSIFYISLEDDLMRIFGSESIDGIMKKFGLKEGESIDHPWINKALERAQQRVEARNFDIRKTLLKFDDVMNDQRQVIFEQRKAILKSNDISGIINSFLEDVIKNISIEKETYARENQLDSFKKKTKPTLGKSIKGLDFKSDSENVNGVDTPAIGATKIKAINGTSKERRPFNIIFTKSSGKVKSRMNKQIGEYSFYSIYTK